MATQILTQRVLADEEAISRLSSKARKSQALEEAHALSNSVGRAWTLATLAGEKVEALDTDALETEALVFALRTGLHEDDARALRMTHLVSALVERLEEAEASHG